MNDSEPPVPPSTQRFAVEPGLCPRQPKVSFRDEILRIGDGVVEIDDGVPPARRNIDGLPRVLDEFERTNGRVGVSNFGEDVAEVVHGFVVASEESGSFDNFFRSSRFEEHPSFSPDDAVVPGGRAEGIDVDAAARPSGTDEQPSIRRSVFFLDEVEQVFGDKRWFEGYLELGKYVQGRIVSERVFVRVPQEIFHRETNRLAVVAFATFQPFLVVYRHHLRVLSHQERLQRPLVIASKSLR